MQVANVSSQCLAVFYHADKRLTMLVVILMLFAFIFILCFGASVEQYNSKFMSDDDYDVCSEVS